VLFVTKCHTDNSSQISHLRRLFFSQYSLNRRPITRGAQEGAKAHKNISLPPGKMCWTSFTLLDLVQKIWAPPRKLFASPGVPSWFRACSIVSYDSWPQVRNKDRFENWQLFGLWKLPFRNDGAIKLTQNCICFINPCINPFVPTSVTREYNPKVLEYLHLLQCISAHLQNTVFPQ